MSAVFADTFYFFAILNARDAAHRQAVAFHSTLRRPLVTTRWVLAELGDGLAQTPSRALFGEVLTRLRSDRRVTIVPATDELFDRGVVLYTDRADKGWSLTDCISFCVMRDMRLTDALTGDKHFEQAGFRALLAS